MDPREAQRRLEQLTDRQRTILQLRCEGLEYREIGQRLHLAKSTVSTEARVMLSRLGIDEETEAAQLTALLKIYAPLLKEHGQAKGADLGPAGPNGPRVIDGRVNPVPNPVQQERPRSAGRFWLGALLGTLFGIGLMAAAAYFLLGHWIWPIPEIPAPETSPRSPIPLASPTSFASPPSLPPPTYAASPQSTDIAIPAATLVPATIAFAPPADGILFEDNFDNGISPDWKNSYFFTSNGALALMTSRAFAGNYDLITLERPQWKNYELSVKVIIPFQYSAAQSDVVIAVRVAGQQKYIGAEINTLSDIYLALIGDYEGHTDYIDGTNSGTAFESGSTVSIAAQGDRYTLKVNGRTVQTITYPGYESGGIALGADCVSTQRCPAFDDVHVTYLP